MTVCPDRSHTAPHRLTHPTIRPAQADILPAQRPQRVWRADGLHRSHGVGNRPRPRRPCTHCPRRDFTAGRRVRPGNQVSVGTASPIRNAGDETRPASRSADRSTAGPCSLPGGSATSNTSRSSCAAPRPLDTARSPVVTVASSSSGTIASSSATSGNSGSAGTRNPGHPVRRKQQLAAFARRNRAERDTRENRIRPFQVCRFRLEPMHERERRQSVGIHFCVLEEVYEPPPGEDHARGRKFWHPVEHQHRRTGREVRAPQPHGIIRGCQRRTALERLDGQLDSAHTSAHTVTPPAIRRRLCRAQRPERLGRAYRPHRARRVRGRPRPRRAVRLAWSVRAMLLGAPHARCRPRVPAAGSRCTSSQP